MKNKWWKHLGKVAAVLIASGLILFQLSEYASASLYFAACLMGLGIIATMVYFFMKQKSDDAI